MTSERDVSKLVLKAIAQGGNRSALFWWMVENHDVIADKAGTRIHWQTVCAAIAEVGLTDTRGRVPSERNARETWRQARLAVARARQKVDAVPAAASRSKPPCRLPTGLQPQVVPPPPGSEPRSQNLPVVLSTGTAVGAPQPASDGEDGMTEEQRRHVAEQFANIKKAFEEHDRKFRF